MARENEKNDDYRKIIGNLFRPGSEKAKDFLKELSPKLKQLSVSEIIEIFSEMKKQVLEKTKVNPDDFCS